MSHIKPKDYQVFVLGLYRLDNSPDGFLSPDQYAKRWGGTMSAQKIKDDLSRGKIPKRWAIRKPFGKKGQFKALIHWDSTVNQYALNLAPELRPSGFDPKETFRPINGPEWVPPMPHEVEDEEIRELDDLANLPQVSTLDEAKLRVEQLKIMKMQAEIRLANNQMIWVDDMVAAGRQMGVELRASLMASKNRMKSELAACNTVQGCDKILENGLREALEIISNPIIPNGQIKNDSSN
jgi:hypothetical protein